MAPRVFVLAIQFATFRSCVWGAVWIKDHGLSYRFTAGDMEGEAVWKRIGNAIEELLSEERLDGAAVHSGSDGTRTTMGAPVSAFRNASRSRFSWAVRPRGLIFSSSQRFFVPPRS